MSICRITAVTKTNNTNTAMEINRYSACWNGINYGHEKWWPFGAAGIYHGRARWLEIVSEAPQLQAEYARYFIDGCVTERIRTRDAGQFLLSRALETATPKPRPVIRDLLIFPAGRRVTVDTTSGRWVDKLKVELV
jgi:hypothetical protein